MFPLSRLLSPLTVERQALVLQDEGMSGPIIQRRTLLVGSGGLAGWLAAGGLSRSAFAGLRAQNVRIGHHAHFTRVVIDLTERVPFSVFSLSEPYRVIIDLPEVEWGAEVDSSLQLQNPLIKALRYGLFHPGNSRVVLDLSAPASVKKAFVLPPRATEVWRLVLDLAPTDAASFLRAAGPARRIGDFRPQEKRDVVPETGQQVVAPSQRPRQTRRPVIVLDPGHGGVDPGATGVSGIFEKKVTLLTAREFKKSLEKTGRYTVHLTRERDVFLQLRERVAIARRHRADLFISIHADAGASPSLRGLSIYTLSDKASDSEAAALAASENKADIIAGIDLSHESPEVTNILIDLAQRESMNLSARLAELAISELRRDVTLLPRSHRFAGFAVLKAPDIPSLLMEMGYLTNRQEERLLRTRTYRRKLASAMIRAIDNYFKTVGTTAHL